MGKRKVFTKTNISVPQVEHDIDTEGNVVVLPEAISPASTVVSFGRSASSHRKFDFARWYGSGIDPITYACQRQIERFLAGQEGTLSVATVVVYCSNGLVQFLDFCALQAMVFECELTLNDVNRNLIDSFLGHLAGRGLSTSGQKSYYTSAKAVLLALGRRGIFSLVTSGDDCSGQLIPDTTLSLFSD